MKILIAILLPVGAIVYLCNFVGLLPVVYVSEYSVLEDYDSGSLSPDLPPIGFEFTYGDDAKIRIIPFLFSYWHIGPPTSYSISVGATSSGAEIVDGYFLTSSGGRTPMTMSGAIPLISDQKNRRFLHSGDLELQIPWSQLGDSKCVLNIATLNGSGGVLRKFQRTMIFNTKHFSAVTTPLLLVMQQ